MLNNDSAQRFYIRFNKWYAILSSLLFIPPSRSYLELDDQHVRVRMAWGFYSHFPRTAIASISLMQRKGIILSRGIHGWGGRWLVNGSAQGIVCIDLMSQQRGYVMGFPIQLSQLLISLEKPAALIELLKNDGEHIEEISPNYGG